MELYVGNLSYSCTDADLAALFEPYGAVESARIATDRMSGLSKGFGFVQMSEDFAASEAIERMNGQAFMGRPLRVTESKPKPRMERPRPQNEGGFDHIGSRGFARY